MCGQVGFILGFPKSPDTTPAWFGHRQELKQIFKSLLADNEIRGPDATGLGWMGSAGETQILRTTMIASEFVKDSECESFLTLLSASSAVLVGHTRWPSKKNFPIHECDNQPLKVGSIWGTHNGTIYNADELFDLWKLPRNAYVDSELIFQLAYKHTNEGIFNLAHFLNDVILMRGQYSGIIVNDRQSHLAWLARGNKPLSIWMQPEWRVVMFNSLRDQVESLGLDRCGWVRLEVPVMSFLQFDRRDLLSYTVIPFDLQQETHAHDPP